jgi:hypothetical protein
LAVNLPTPIADMIAEMHASGIQLDTIIVAVRSMERALSTRQQVDEVAEKRRAWDRNYRRAKRGLPPDPPDIHPIPPDVGNVALSSLEKKDSCSVSKKEKKERGHKLPPDWKPNEKHYAEGLRLGMTRDEVNERADRMRSWCDANSNRSITTKSNWDAAFMGAWLKDSRNGNGSSQNRANSPAGRASSRDADILAAVGRGALRVLENGYAARAVGPVPANPGPSEGNDSESERMYADYQSRIGHR